MLMKAAATAEMAARNERLVPHPLCLWKLDHERESRTEGREMEYKTRNPEEYEY